MQISTITLPLVVTQPAKNTATSMPLNEQALNPLVPRDPSALQVTLSPVNTQESLPPVYDKPSVNRVYVRNNADAQQGVVSALVTKTLSSHLTALQENTVPFSAGLFFKQAGTLSRETSSYSNEARSVQVPATVATEKFTPDFTRQTGKVSASATVNIRTKDGDSISLNLVQSNDGKGLSFSFEVEGELSEAEQLALEKLATKLGEIADEFFRSGSAELRGLEEFDQAVLGSFSLSLSQFNGEDYDTFTYDYSIDEATNTVELSGKDVAGYTFDISAQLSGLTDGKTTAAHTSLEQYLALIRQAGDDHDTRSSSVRFMLDGLRSMLMSAADKPEASDKPLARIIEDFDTGLPDFSASFNAPTIPNPSNYSQVSSLNLSMGQRTQIDVVNSRTVIQQETFYELSQNNFEASGGLDAPDLDGGNYVYVNQHIRESTVRTMDIEGGRAKAIFVEHTHEWQRSEQVLENFETIDQRKSGDSDRELVNLIDQLDANQKQHDLSGLVRNSRTNFFERW